MTEMSFCSNTLGVLWCENATVAESGAQSSAVTCTWPVSSFFDVRFPPWSLVTGTTYRPASFSFSSMTRASLFSFAAFSSSSDFGSGMMKAIDVPSGDHLNAVIDAFSDVI
jgi:hypothetical protein